MGATNSVTLRTYREEDFPSLAELFYNTVHNISRDDYTSEQLDAWADGNIDRERWNSSFLKNHTLIAECDGKIVGFADMESGGYLDRLYVSHLHQRRGIATALVTALERQATANGVTAFETHASITARPFFERFGYVVVKENTVVRHGVSMTNFLMRKEGV